jgi:hypothetical protein
MTTHDTWILVSIPDRRTGRGLAARIALRLLSWAEHRDGRPGRSVELDRIERPALAQRPFC